MGKFFVKFIGASLLALVTSSAWAIPPSEFIVKSWVAKHGNLKSIRMRSVISAVENQKPTGVHFKEIAVYLPGAQVLRSWVLDDSDKKLFYVEKSLTELAPVGQALLSSDSVELLRTLKMRNIPIRTDQELLPLKTEEDRRKAEVGSFERYNGGMYWVVGNTDPKAPPVTGQLWFEKDLFLLRRMIYPSMVDSATPNMDDLKEFRLDNYRYFRDFTYPSYVHFLDKGTELLSSQLVDCTLNADHLTYKKSQTPTEMGLSEEGKAAPGAVKDLIRLYYDVVR